jgi:hypothetical protein
MERYFKAWAIVRGVKYELDRPNFAKLMAAVNRAAHTVEVQARWKAGDAERDEVTVLDLASPPQMGWSEDEAPTRRRDPLL